MGDMVLGIILQEKGLLPEFIPSPAPVLVTIFDESLLRESFSLAAELRSAGLNVLCYPEPVKLQKQFKFADKMKARIVVTVGPDEAANAQVAVKNLMSGEQVTVGRDAAVEVIRKILAGVIS
jgi:histidyl-tRNA synthetase